MVMRIVANGSAHEAVGRTVAHQAPGMLHLAVSIQVVDLTRGHWLLQRRAAGKAMFANRWANTCCTHPAPSEDPAAAARRRLREETGLVVDDLVPAGSFTYRATDERSGLVEHEHDFVFVAVLDTDAANPDPNEISELKLLPFEDAVNLLQSDVGAPWAVDVLRRSNAALNRVRQPPQPDYAASDDAAVSRVDHSAENKTGS
jgi:isopentenyl-diphosphate delta-isomerase